MIPKNQSLANVDLEDANTDQGRGSRRRRQRSAKEETLETRSFPYLKDMYGVFIFLVIPAAIIILSVLFKVAIPKAVLYGIAMVLGLILVARAYSSVELVLAIAIMYLPFSKTYIIPLAPGLNGTNVFLLLLLMAAFFQANRLKTSMIELMPGSRFVFAFAIISSYSAVTLSLLVGGFDYLRFELSHVYKAWIDQFVLYFAVHSVIRTSDVAKRVVLYVSIGSLAVVFASVPEMLEKMGNSSIDKMRVGGPHLQPNNFGGFVAYTIIPIIALFTVYIENLRAWLLTPYILLSAKLLITSFSRAAYLAIAASALFVAYFRGKKFFFSWMMVALLVLLAVPSLIPDSVLSRMNSTQSRISTTDEKLDKSSQTRLVLWEAAIEMSLESPVLGKGFGMFPLLKYQYTDTHVAESDNHNMYLYISSQMGIPAMILFILIMINMFEMGRRLARTSDDKFIRAAGIGAIGMATCMSIVNLFGSRFINIDFTCYFLVYYVVIQVFTKEQREKDNILKEKKRVKRNLPRPVSR